ncbi:MAG: 3'-5' exonuclease domain-containing protein 2, partial [Kiritimatiellaceae bacterium]|nr:3'-5' exonuclease domain-containing protein 2 [Kiritimatiellaceae bacterium]
KQYAGPIHLIRTPEEVEQAANKLLAEPVLGFDTETRPSFQVGESYPPSLLQLATEHEVFILQLKLTGLPPGLCAILSDPNRIKTGISLRDDLKELRKLADFEPAGFVELAEHAKRAHIKNLGLRGLAALLLGFRISKREQTSNWAKTELTESQLRYAATDAWLGRQLYLHMQSLNLIHNTKNNQPHQNKTCEKLV